MKKRVTISKMKVKKKREMKTRRKRKGKKRKKDIKNQSFNSTKIFSIKKKKKP